MKTSVGFTNVDIAIYVYLVLKWKDVIFNQIIKVPELPTPYFCIWLLNILKITDRNILSFLFSPLPKIRKKCRKKKDNGQLVHFGMFHIKK